MKKRRNIRIKDMRPEVRLIGVVLRFFMPECSSEKMLCIQNQFTDKFMRGKWLGRNTKIQTKYIKREDGSRLRILICTSKKGTKPNATGLLWMHGGGYAVGFPEQDFINVDRFVKDGNTVAVLPDYIRTTQKPYPAALEDCYLALKWLKNHTKELNVNPDQLFIGGDSAGGGLTAAITLYARDKKEVAIAFQMPLYPMLDDRMITKSSQNNDAPVWNSKSNRAAWNMLLRGLKKGEPIPQYAAPARAKDLSNLPPACTYVGSIEPFRDETVAYAKGLKQQGIDVHMKVYKGCFHAFDLNCYPTKAAKDARMFLMNTYHYAQKHYFAKQPKEQNNRKRTKGSNCL